MDVLFPDLGDVGIILITLVALGLILWGAYHLFKLPTMGLFALPYAVFLLFATAFKDGKECIQREYVQMEVDLDIIGENRMFDRFMRKLKFVSKIFWKILRIIFAIVVILGFISVLLYVFFRLIFS